MTDELLIAPAHVEPLVHTNDQGATQPPPTVVQQQVSDDVFSREQREAVAALMAAQMGLGLLHNLAVETFSRPAEEPPPPRRKDRPEEEE